MEKEHLTPLEAIRRKCVDDCCSGYMSEVRNCMCQSCPLYEFRFGKNPYSNRKSNPDVCKKMRAARQNKNENS